MSMKQHKIILWGTFDTGKPRVRIMRDALRQKPDAEMMEIGQHVWQDVADKSRLGAGGTLRVAGRMLLAYPKLLWRYCRAPKHQTVVVGYMGLWDVLLLALFARLRGAQIVWDMFLSLYDTAVCDRQMLSRANPLAWALYAAEWLACRAAHRVVLDTQIHANYIAALYGLPAHKMAAVLVGAEESFAPAPSEPSQNFEVLFYGQCIALHGMDTIIRAAQANTRPNISWTLIGDGQEAERMRSLLGEHPVENLKWLPWVQYAQLHTYIHKADVCLGIFGSSAKAGNVIANKVYQALACAKPVITRESAAIEELPQAARQQVITVPPSDAKALLLAIHTCMDDPPSAAAQPMLEEIYRHWQAIVTLRR